jgi:cob(I)alamin adenosyltransferase
MVHFLEQRIDQYLTQSPPLDKFILPGGSQAASYLHVARTVARRAERCVVTLTQRQAVNPYVRKYLNRVSDYLFALARVINVRQNIQDIEYIRSASVFKKGKK